MFICLSLPYHKNLGCKKVKIFVCLIHQCIQDTHILRHLLSEHKNKWLNFNAYTFMKAHFSAPVGLCYSSITGPSFSLYQGPPCCTCSSPPPPEQHSFMLTAIRVTASALIILREPNESQRASAQKRPERTLLQTSQHPTLPCWDRASSQLVPSTTCANKVRSVTFKHASHPRSFNHKTMKSNLISLLSSSAPATKTPLCTIH